MPSTVNSTLYNYNETNTNLSLSYYLGEDNNIWTWFISLLKETIIQLFEQGFHLDQKDWPRALILTRKEARSMDKKLRQYLPSHDQKVAC